MDKVEKYLDLESSAEHPSLYKVVWRGGPGKVPATLGGLWTRRTGYQAIENYNNSKG